MSPQSVDAGTGAGVEFGLEHETWLTAISAQHVAKTTDRAERHAV